MKIAVVIASNRPEAVNEMLEAWDKEFTNENVKVFLVQDVDSAFPVEGRGCEVESFTRKDFPEFILPKNASVKSFGFLQAYKQGYDIIICLDDDCLPNSTSLGFIKEHVWNLGMKQPVSRWKNTIWSTKLFARGFPYSERELHPVMLHMGLWTGHPDLDGITRLKLEDSPGEYNLNAYEVMPKGVYFPFSGMNFSFKRELTPLIFQANIPRWEDIWTGIIAKKIMDHFNMAVTYGLPYVNHTGLSDIKKVIKQESKNMVVNEVFWKHIDSLKFEKKDNVITCYEKVIKHLRTVNHEEMDFLADQMEGWIKNFK